LSKETAKYRLGSAYIWQSQEENMSRKSEIIKEIFNDIEKQNLFANIREKISLVFYSGKKRK
jgi:hypothetical protein